MTVNVLGRITGWSKRKKLAFAYLTCERLYPNYVFFHEQFHFGEPAVLQEALVFLRDAIFSGSVNTAHIDRLHDSLDKSIPAPEDFPTTLASSALDACTSLESALEFLRTRSDQLIDDISVMATDTVQLYIQERDDMDGNTDGEFDQKIMNDALMMQEMKIQNGIIAYLGKIDELQPSDLDTLLQLQENDGRGNLGL